MTPLHLNVHRDNRHIKLFSEKISREKVVYWLKMYREQGIDERAIKFAMRNHSITEAELATPKQGAAQ